MDIFLPFYHLPQYSLRTFLKVGGNTTVLALYDCMCGKIELIKHWWILHKKPREV